MAQVLMTYGTYNFSPVPIVSLNKTFNKSADGTPLGVTFRLSLAGTLVAYPTGGILNVDRLQDALISGLACEGSEFKIVCVEDGATGLILQAFPRINEISFQPSNDNWVFTTPYTIELEYDEYQGSGDFNGEFEACNFDTILQFISDAREDWQLEFVEDRNKYDWLLTSSGNIPDASPYVLRLTHNVSAVGKRHYTPSGLTKLPWEQAKAYVLGRIGLDTSKITSSGYMNFTPTMVIPFNHIRSEQIDELGGSYSITESWLLVTPSGSGIAGKGLEDFNITTRRGVDNGLTTVSIEGSIQGLENRNYGVSTGEYSVIETKYAAAESYWTNVRPKIYNRARKVGDLLTSRTLNTIALSESIGYNPPQGTITYSYEYNDRPSNCITGAFSENISVVDNNPTDVFASLTILGRSAGPILQDIGTKTSPSREVSVECVMLPGTGCPSTAGGATAFLAQRPRGQVSGIIQGFYDELAASYGQVFKTQDSERWEPKEGRYSRVVTWTYQGCS